MSPETKATLALMGQSKALLACLATEFRQSDLAVNLDKPAGDYRVVALDLSQFAPDSSELLTLISTPQKTALLLIVSSLESKGLLESCLKILDPKLKDPSLNLRLLICFDLYSPSNSEVISGFEKILSDVLKTQHFAVSHDGNYPIFPLSVSDLARATLKSLFTQNTKGQTFFLSEGPTADLELAYQIKAVLQEYDRPLDLDTVTTPSQLAASQTDFIRSEAILNWLPQDTLKAHLKHLVRKLIADDLSAHPDISAFSDLNSGLIIPPSIPDAEIKIQTKPESRSLFKKFKKSKKLAPKPSEKPENLTVKSVEERGLLSLLKIALPLFLVSVLGPYLIFLSSLAISAKTLTLSYSAFHQADLKKAQTWLNYSRHSLDISDFWFQKTLPVSNLISSTKTQELNDYLLLLRHGESLLSTTYDSEQLFDRFYQSLLGRADPVNPDILLGLHTNLNNLYENFSQIELLLDQIKVPSLISTNIFNQNFVTQTKILKGQIQSGLNLLDILEAISKKGSLTKILVLVQDDTELRPSGGFLNTTLLLTFSQNRLLNWQVESSLAVDRLIEGRVDPPSIISSALGQNQWFFRDSNIDANFPSAAQQVSWFYNRFKNQSIDAVVAINSSYLKNLLAETGPIVLANGQQVTSENLRLLLENPNTDPNSDLLTNLTQNLADKLSSGNINFVSFARSLVSTINSGDLLLWFADSKLESLVPNNLTGEIRLNPCPLQLGKDCFPDLVYLNESNLSVAKINAYQLRQQEHHITISDTGQIQYDLNYLYSYPVAAPSNLNQNYQAYYQLYLNSSTSFPNISFDNEPLKTSSITAKNLGLVTKYEFLIPEPLNQKHQLRLQFNSGQTVNLSALQTPFELLLPRQPGTNDSVKIRLQYPTKILPKILTSDMKITAAGQLDYSAANSSTSVFGVLFHNLELR